MRKFLRSKLGIVIILVAAILLLIFFHKLNLLKPIENILTTVFEPVQKPLANAGDRINNFFNHFKSLSSLRKENDKLKGEINKLLVENNGLKTIIEENKLLNEQLKFVQERNYHYVSAKVIGKSPDNIQLLIINKGGSDGLKNDLPVIINDGILIGKIIDTQSNVAKVLLLTDSHSIISASIDNNNKSQGTVKGEHGLSLKMDLIPLDHKVESGQLVATSGLESNMPAGLIIGKINKTFSRKGELFQQANITPAASFNNLSIVTIIVI